MKSPGISRNLQESPICDFENIYIGTQNRCAKYKGAVFNRTHFTGISIFSWVFGDKKALGGGGSKMDFFVRKYDKS